MPHSAAHRQALGVVYELGELPGSLARSLVVPAQTVSTVSVAAKTPQVGRRPERTNHSVAGTHLLQRGRV